MNDTGTILMIIFCDIRSIYGHDEVIISLIDFLDLRVKFLKYNRLLSDCNMIYITKLRDDSTGNFIFAGALSSVTCV